MDDDPGPGWALDHYAVAGEERRLTAGQGLLERDRTRELLLRHLPAAPCRVADIGAGPGAHSLWLAQRGYDVVARDLTPRHVEQLAADAAQLGLTVDAAVGDARALDIADASCDAVLVLGPLYHLVDRGGRIRCLREAARIAKPGGVVAAAAISRWAVLLDDVLLKRIGEGIPGFASVLDAALQTGVLAPVAPGRFGGFCHRPEELRAEIAEAGLRGLALVTIEGPGAYLADLEQRWRTATAREPVLDAARRLEAVPELCGVGPHLMLVAERP